MKWRSEQEQSDVGDTLDVALRDLSFPKMKSENIKSGRFFY